MTTNEVPLKLAVIVQADLMTWQKLNVTAFLVSGVAHANPMTLGEPYEDGSGNRYLPMFGQPVMVYEADAAGVSTALERARSRGVDTTLFTEELFATGNDADNRAAVRGVNADALEVVGIAFCAGRNVADKVLKGLKLHS